MEFYSTERGGQVMAYQDHQYIRRRIINGLIHWRCRQHISWKCHSKMKTTDDQSYKIISEPTEHSHDPLPQKIKANIAITKMKENISSVGATPSEVVGSVLNEMKLPREVQLLMPKKSSIDRTLNRVRDKEVDSIRNPVCTQLLIPDQYKDVLYDSGEDDSDQISATGDKEVQQELMKGNIFGDGTFDQELNIKDELVPMGEEQSEPTDKSQTTSKSTPSTPSASQSALEANWPDVIKMNDYLNTGRRQQFWEEPFTKRVMDAIKNKDLEMKSAAELLGVSYGTLYGRYRDAYGCLKHPYRVRDFWTESGPADILSKLQRKEITLFRAAEQLNVTPQTLSNYLLSLHQGNDSVSLMDEANSSQMGPYDGYEELPDSDDEKDSILPDVPARPSSSSSARSSSQLTASNILQNHPDITIIKKEKKEEVKVNNNSDHSEPVSDENDA